MDWKHYDCGIINLNGSPERAADGIHSCYILFAGILGRLAEEMNNTQYIGQSSIFSGLEEADLKKIADISIERKYKKNMIIFLEGEPGDGFYYIKSGKIKVYRTYMDGKEHIIHIFGAGEVIGEATLFTNIPYPASAVVYEDSVVGCIKNSDLEALVKENSDLALSIIRILVRKLSLGQEKIRSLAFNDVFSRCATLLLKLAQDHGLETDSGIMIDIQLTRQELAEMAGTTRETISRAMSRFKKEKSLTEKDDRIVILNKSKLEGWQ